MSEIKQARSIDREKMLKWMDGKMYGAKDSVIFQMVKSGAFDIQSDQGEAARLREALTQIGSINFPSEFESINMENAYKLCLGEISRIVREALSSHTENTWNQLRTGIKDKNGNEICGGHHCEVYIDGESPNNGFGKAIVKWSRERECWMFDFYEGVNWGTDTQEPVTEFDNSYIEVITIPGINTER
jgi:hypothetical protein